MTISELLNELHEAGMIDIRNDRPDAPEQDIDTWLDKRGIDAETPIPVWNPDADAWEV